MVSVCPSGSQRGVASPSWMVWFVWTVVRNFFSHFFLRLLRLSCWLVWNPLTESKWMESFPRSNLSLWLVWLVLLSVVTGLLLFSLGNRLIYVCTCILVLRPEARVVKPKKPIYLQLRSTLFRVHIRQGSWCSQLQSFMVWLDQQVTKATTWYSVQVVH
jgi:hypothetical protein